MSTITLTLNPVTADWLNRESAYSKQTPEDFAAELLRELADPDHVEGNVIDRILAESANYLPVVMTIEELSKVRGELLDFLFRRLIETYRQTTGETMTFSEQAHLRNRLEMRPGTVWS